MYKWPYNTPKDSVSKISQSSLPYEESFSPYVSAIKNGVEYMLYFDEETKKVTEFVIKKE